MDKLTQKSEVVKRNVLATAIYGKMSTSEKKVFAMYLSLIDRKDKSTREVKIKLSDYQKITGFDFHNFDFLEKTIVSLLQRVVRIDTSENEIGYYQLFSKAKIVNKNKPDGYILLNAHDEAIPLLFEYPNKFYHFPIVYYLSLSSVNQLNLYDLLKANEWLGSVEFTIEELKKYMEIDINAYSRFGDFKTNVLDVCKKAICENTDITFTYEKGKSGAKGKWLSIVFNIYPKEISLDDTNDSKIIDISLEEHNESDEESEDEKRIREYGNDYLATLAEGCNYEFNQFEMQQISCILQRIHIQEDPITHSILYGKQLYLREKYAALNAQDTKKLTFGGNSIKNRFKYFVSMIEKDVER